MLLLVERVQAAPKSLGIPIDDDDTTPQKYKRQHKPEDDIETQGEAEGTETQENNEANKEPPVNNADDESWRDRYGNLRRLTQKKDDRIKELERQLEDAGRKEIKLPKTKEELEAWSKKYPDVAKMVETIATQKAMEISKDLEKRLERVSELESNIARDKAEAELARLHPDFQEIRLDKKFHEWAEEQPEWVQKALYDNETDAMSTARAIDLYKADMGIEKKRGPGRPKKEEQKDAAKKVTTTRNSDTNPDNMGDEEVWSESRVAKMNDYEYEEHEAEINKAIRAGKFVYDISGAAR